MNKKLRFTIILIFLFISGAFANQGGEDNFGYMWTNSVGTPSINYDWINAKDGTRLFNSLSQNTFSNPPVSLPFGFTFYGVTSNSIYVSTNGWVSFTNPGGAFPTSSPIPTGGLPNSLIAVFWANLSSLSGAGGSPGVYYKTVGNAPYRKFVIEWDGYYFSGSQPSVNFELILYENNNLIKIQYNYILNSTWTPVVGIEADGTQGIQYPAGSVTSNSAVLFHPKNLGSNVDASISPTSVPAGSFGEFTYTFSNIDLAGTTGMGKVDRMAIANPFTGRIPTVTSIQINSTQAFIQNSTIAPVDRGFATWFLRTGGPNDSLIIQTANFDVIDTLRINFALSIPSATSSGNNFASTYDARLDSTTVQNATNDGWAVDVVGNQVAYYEFSPSGPQSTTAGIGLGFTVTARDIYGNGVNSTDNVVFTASGSSSAVFTVDDTLNFGGGSVVNVTVTDTVVGAFTIVARRQGDPGVTGQSGLMTVNPGDASRFVVLTGTEDPITVGTERLLQVALQDAYGNRLRDSLVTFTRFNGNGIFPVTGTNTRNITTNSSGIAEALYRASTLATFVDDSIAVSFGGTLDTLVLPLQVPSGLVSYYDVTPSGPQSTMAGIGLGFTATARDIYGNAVNSTDNVVFTASGSSTAQFTANDTLNFSGGSVVNVTVMDTVVGTFTVVARREADPAVTGQSGTVTVTVAGPDTLIAQTTSDTTIVVDKTLTLSVRLEDQYGNPISGQSLLFDRIRGTDGRFTANNGISINRATNSSGVATAIYRVSTQADTDSVVVSLGSLAPVGFSMNLLPDSISYYTFVPQTGSYAAGADIVLQVTGFDVFDNRTTNSSRQVTLSTTALGAEYRSPNPASLDSGRVSFTVVDTIAQTGLVFTVSDVYGKSANTQNFTITTAALDYLIIRSGAGNTGLVWTSRDSSITTDNTLTLYAAGYDQYGNYRNDVTNTAWTTSGNLVPALTDQAGASLFYQPTVSGRSGRIFARVPSQPTVQTDTTGTITVGGGSGSEVRITYSPGGTELGDSSFVAGDTLRLYASQFDASGNFLNLVEGDWTISPSNLGRFENATNTITDGTVRFQAYRIGSGTILLDFGGQTDVTGLLTVTLGSADSIVIRDQANGGGTPYRNQTLNITTDSSITLYAAHYDAMGNFRRDSAITWDAIEETGSGLSPLPAGPASQITFSPTLAGTGRIVTTSPSLVNDTSGVISVTPGALSYIVIQNVSGAGGTEIGDVTLNAGQSLNLFASGYDTDSNYVGDQTVNWSLVGDPIGTFTANPASNSTFNADSIGNAQIRAVTTVGNRIDVTGNIVVNAGAPNTITIFGGNDQSGPVAQQLPVPLQVLVEDAQGNPVPSITIQWVPTLGGTVSSGFSLTNAQGIAQTYWTLHNSTTVDTVIAYISGVTTTPDTLYFTAYPEPTSGLVLNRLTPITYSGQILIQVGPYQVEVRDSLNNVVPNVRVGFAIVGRPAGSGGETLSADTAFTNSSGIAETYLTLGSKLGTYTVRAFANTTPGFVDFTGVADSPGNADSVVILAGNNQTGTVGQPLAQNIRVRLVDVYLNPLPDSTLIFDTLTGSGTATPGSAVTDASGEATFSWTLDTLAGINELIVRVQESNVISDTLIATGLRDAAANINLVSVRGVTRDSLSAMPNGPVSFTMQVTDQYGNPVSDEIVTSEIQTGNNAQITDNTSITNSNGRFVNSLLIDPAADLTTLRSFVAGVDTAYANVYRISYAVASLDPPAVALGTDTAFSVQVNNPGPYPVALNTALSNINFSDGTRIYQASLNPSSDSIPAGTNDFQLNFQSALVNPNFVPSNYQSRITLRGTGSDGNVNGYFLTGPNDLRIFGIELVSATVDSPFTRIVRRGDDFIAQLEIRNRGNVSITIDPANTSPVIRLDGTFVSNNFIRLDTLTQINPNSTVFLRYRFSETATFAVDSYSLDGTFVGTVNESGQIESDTSATITDLFEIISGAVVAYQNGSLSPIRVNSEDYATFSLILNNTGDGNVFLQASGTYLTFSADTIYLNGNQTLTGNAGSMLNFVPDSIETAAAPVPFQPTLVLFGQENGADYRDTLALGEITDQISVFNIPTVAVAAFSIDSTEASQGESGITLSYNITNIGALNDDIIIQTPQDLTLSNRSNETFIPTLTSPLTSQFPRTIPADGSQIIRYSLEFPDNYAAGLDTFWAAIRYRDGNTSRVNVFADSMSPAAIDTIRILQRSNVEILDIAILGSDTVSQGQPGVEFRMYFRNQGEVAARVDTARLIFQNNHTITMVPTFGFILPGGEIDSFDFEISINPNASLGIEPIRGSLDYTNVRSLATDIYSSPALDSLYIQSFSQGLISLHSVSIDRLNVNRGQTGITARVRVTNGGQAGVRVDNLALSFAPTALGQVLTSPALPYTLNGGATQTFNFAVSVPALATLGLDTVDALIAYTDLNSSISYNDTGVVNIDTVFIQTPAAFTISAVQIDQDTVSAGKTNLTVDFQVENTGEAAAQITQALPVITPFPDSIALTRLSPATLPVINGGDTASFVYRADVGDTTGTFDINFNITGRDLNDSRIQGPQSSPTPATLVVRQPGTIVIDSVVIGPTTVSIGQSGIIATVYLQNDGEMPVNVNNLVLLFNGSFTGFAQIPLGSTNFNLNGGEATTRDFSLTVLENAPASVTVNARATGTELNLGQSLTSFANQTDILAVQGASELRILSVSSPYDSVSRGQSGITARVRIRNSGGTTALIDTLALRFSRGTYTNYDTTFTPAQVVPAGATFNFDFNNISVNPASILGVASVNARLVARDSVSNDTLLVENADTTHSWRVVTPGNLQYLSLTPARVTINQNVGFAVRVQNLGQANMYLLPTTRLNVDALTIPITDTTLVPGGQTRDIVFQAAVVSLPAGLYDVSMNYDFLENLASDSRTLDVLDSVRVDNPVGLDTLSTTYPRTLSQNMTLPISINLTNTAGSATAILDSVVIPELGYNLPINASLPGGSDRIDNLQPYINTSISGVLILTVNYYWRDANSGITQITGFALNPITVLTRAQLTVLDITGPLSVFAGQQDVELQVQIQNSGQVTAIIDTLYLTQQIGIYTKTLVTTDTLIPGGSTSTFIFSLDISPTTATGIDNFGAVVQGTDSISSNTINATGNNLHTWIIYQALNAEIVSVSSPRTLVSQGQQNIAFTVQVRNNSNQTLTVDTLQLYPRALPGTNYSYIPPVITSGTISSGQTSLFNFNVNISPNAIAGLDTIDARLAVSSALTLDTIRVDSSNVPHTWTVQERPVLSTTSLQITPDRMSIIPPFPPQDYAPMVVQVRSAANPEAGSARLDSVKIIANDVIITDPNILDIAQLSVLPVTLQQDNQVPVNFGIRPGTSTVPGTYNFRSLIYYTDINSGIQYTDTTSAILDVLIIETPANLSNNFIAPVVNRYETHWGKTGDTLSVMIYNNGQAMARITGSALDVVTGSAYAQQNIMGTLIGLTLPTNLNGGSSLEFRYRLDYPPVPSGQYDDEVQYQILIDYEDGNNSQFSPTLSTFPSSDTVNVLTPPSLSFAVNGLLPSRVEPGTREAFSVSLINSGNSEIFLDTALTQFSILGVPEIPASWNSSLVILPDDTTTLLFDSVDVNLGEGFYITETRVVGSYHDDIFDQTLTTGQLQVGGAIQISSITFLGLPPVPFLRLGQTNVSVRMAVRSFRPDTLQIDSLLTSLEFRDGSSGIQISSSLFNLRRMDSLTVLLPQTTTFLDFEFDIPTILALGPYWIRGRIQATNGIENFEAYTAEDAARFNITSGAELNYVANSLQPDIGIPNQTISFRVDLTNTEAARFQLEAANSFLTIFNNIDTLPPINLDAPYAIPGNSTVSVSFLSATLPSDFPTGFYNISLQLNGMLENGDLYDTTLVADSQFTVLRQAELVLRYFDIPRTSVITPTFGIPLVTRFRNYGESVARLSSLTFQFEDALGQNVSNEWVLTGRDVSLPALVDPGDSITINNTFFLRENATLGPISAGAEWQYNDTLRSLVVIDSLRQDLDVVNVITGGILYIESTTIPDLPNQTPTLAYADTGQDFTILTRIPNDGQDTLINISITLYRNDIPIDTISGLNVAGGDTLSVSFPTQATASPGLLFYRTRITEVFSSDSLPTSPDEPRDNTENVQVQYPARLQLIATPTDIVILALNQQFNLTATITNLGQASIGNGQLRLILPPNYSTQPENDTLRSFAAPGNIIWTIQGNSVTSDPDPDSIKVEFATIPLDLNYDSTATVDPGADSVYVRVRVEEAGQIVSTIDIFSPSGAQDSVVSTFQTFVIRNIVEFTGAVQDTGRTSTLILPAGAGFSVENNAISLQDSVTIDTVIWTVQAPSVPRGFSDFQVNTQAISSISGSPINQTSNILPIMVVPRAVVSISGELIEPGGVLDNVASTNQSFVVRYWTTNTGVALTSGSSLVRLTLQAGLGFDVGLTDQTDTLYIAAGDTQSVRVYTGNTAYSLRNIDAMILVAANDTNSNAPAQIGTALSRISIQVVNEAALVLNLDLSSVTVSPDQVFRLRGELTNVGTAGVLPGGLVGVRLDTLGTGFRFEGDVALKSVLVSDTVSWLLRSPAFTDTVALYARVDDNVAYDENKYPDSLVVRQVGEDSTVVRVTTGGVVNVANIQLVSPPGATDDTVSTVQQFTLSSTAEFFGSVSLVGRTVELVPPPGGVFGLIDPGLRTVSGDTTLTWRITAPASVSGPTSYWFDVVVRGTEQNTGDPLSATDSLLVTVVPRAVVSISGELVEPGGVLDNVASTNQSFVVRYWTTNTGVALTSGSSLVRLTLQAGLGFDVGLTDQTDTLYIAAGDTQSVRVYTGNTAYSLRNIDAMILVAANDTNSNAPAQIGTALSRISIQVVNEAALVLNMSTDSIQVSPTQQFTLSATLQNAGNASIEPGDSVWIRLDTTGTLITFDNDTDRKRVVLINDLAVIDWQLIAGGSINNYNLVALIDDNTAYDENKYPDSLVFRQKGSDTTRVNVVEGGALSITDISIIDPPGAVDTTLSTGQEFTLSASFLFNQTVAANGRSTQLILPSGFIALDGQTRTLPAGIDNATWRIRVIDDLQPGAVLDTFNLQINLFGSEANTGENLSAQALQRIFVEPRAILQVSLKIVDPEGAKDNIVSTNQQFNVSYRVENVGVAPVYDSSLVQVTLPLTGFSFAPGTSVRQSSFKVLTGDSVIIPVYTGSTQQAFRNLSAVIVPDSAAKDANSDRPAATSGTALLQVSIISEARLTLSIDDTAQIVSQGQTFSISGTVQKLGSSGLAPIDSVQIKLDFDTTHFHFSTGYTAHQNVDLSNNIGDYSWGIVADTTLGDYTFTVSFDDAAVYDENKFPGTPIQIANDSVRATISVETSGNVNITRIEIVDPPGATDDTLSTDQQFTLEADIQFNSSISPSGRRALLELGQGFVQITPLLQNLDGTETLRTVSWILRAPSDTLSKLLNKQPGGVSSSSMVKSIEKGSSNNDFLEIFQKALTITATAIDANSGAQRQDVDSIMVHVVEKAKLAVSADIRAPEGAKDGTVSTNQYFEVEIRVDNSGVASASGPSKIKVTLPVGFGFDRFNTQIQSVDSFFIAENESIIDTIYTDTTNEHKDFQNIIVRLDSAANDMNSDLPASVIVPQDLISNLRIVKRAELVLNTSSTPPDTIAQGQEFIFSNVVNNVGTAGINPDSLWLRIDLDNNNLTVVDGQTTKYTPLNQAVNWRLRSTGSAEGVTNISVSIDTILTPAKDANFNYDSTKVYISQAKRDYSVEVINQTYLQIDSLILISAVETNDTITVSTEQDNIQLHLESSFNSVFSEGRLAVLKFPAGISLTDSLSKEIPHSGVVNWEFVAPQFPKSRFPIEVSIQATSPVNDTTVVQKETVYMTVVSRSYLTLNTEITSPPGARDSIVSYGQTFYFKATIENLGHVSTITDSGRLKIIAGDSLRIKISNGGNPHYANQDVKFFGLENRKASIEWEIEARENPTVNGLLSHLNELKTERKNLQNTVLRTGMKKIANFNKNSLEKIKSQIGVVNKELLNILADSSYLQVLFDSIPNDNYTGNHSMVSTSSLSTPIIILAGAIFEVNNIEAPNIISTDQVFKVTAVIDTSLQVSPNRYARLEFPPEYSSQLNGFRFAEYGIEKLFLGDTVSWEVRAPKFNTITGQVEVDSMVVHIRSTDSNTGDVLLDSSKVRLTLIREATLGIDTLRIINPPNSKGLLSFNQDFTIQATIRNYGDAQMSGNGEMRVVLNSEDGIVLRSDSLVSFTWNELEQTAILVWDLRTPGEPINANVGTAFTSILPISVISNEPVSLDPERSIASLAIRTDIQELTVVPLKNVLPDTNADRIYRQNTPDISIIGFLLNNPEIVDISVDSISISFLTSDGGQLEAPQNLVSSIKITNTLRRPGSLSKINQAPTVLGRYDLSAPVPDSILIPLAPSLVVESKASVNDTLVVWADLTGRESKKSFKVRVNNIFASVFEVGARANVVDLIGNFYNGSTIGTSEIITILSTNNDIVFGNYPNPFGEGSPSNEPVTKFFFTAESQGKVELKVYTLLGGLVYSKEIDVPSRGDYGGLLNWDGKNDIGRAVLNGVYIAVLRVNGKTYKTKVAFIK